MKKRLLLVNPACGTSFWGFEYAMPIAGGAYSNAPLPLLTVAALCPEDWEIRLIDENVDEVDLDHPCDLVGITAMNTQAERAFALAAAFRARGKTVVIGGPFATLEPERVLPHADVVVVGEAEESWPRFCRDFESGRFEARYEASERPELSTSPVPRYDLLKRGCYANLPIQTTRGCPFSCEFCDIIVMQGQKVRSKPVEQVLAELDAARAAGAVSIFFTDDNFIGKPRYTKELLEALIAHRERTGFRPMLFSQASVNLAEKPELLARMVEAGFTRLFLGIESPRAASLQGAGKRQNLRGDLIDRIHTIQRAGLMVWAGMVVGFDHDDPDIFEEQYRFITEAGIGVAMVGILNAPPRTPLYARLVRDGRIHDSKSWTDNCAWTNIHPLLMSRAELFAGYARLLERLYEPKAYAARVLANVTRMAPPSARVATVPQPHMLAKLVRALRVFVLSRDPAMRSFFLPNLLRLLWSSPRRLTEGAVHLGMWRHFQRYVPELALALRAGAKAELSSS